MIRKNRYTSITYLEDVELYVITSVMNFMNLGMNVTTTAYTCESETVYI